MPDAPRALRIAFCALAAIGISLAASGRDETRKRVTIRGTGNDISVERSEALTAPARKPELTRAVAEPTVLSEAIRMKQAGRPDEEVLAYLRSHASQLPVVIDLESANGLRRAGAGKPVLAYLASVSAIEIGDSGAVGGGPEPAPSPQPEEDTGFEPQYGYPVFDGYSSPAFAPRFHSRGFQRPMGVPRVPASAAPRAFAPGRIPPAALERRVFFGRR